MAGRLNRSCMGRRGTNVRARSALAVLVLALGWFAHFPVDSAPPNDDQQAAPNNADELFRNERWVEARAAYDARTKGRDQQSRSFRDAMRGAVLASLKLKDWPGALGRAKSLIAPRPADRDDEPSNWRWNAEESETWHAALAHFDFVHGLLTEIAAATPAAERDFAKRLSAARIELDERLVEHLDPQRDREPWGWDRALESVSWWWNGVAEAQDYINSNPRYSRWHHEIGIALSHDGRPIFLEPPPQYAPDLPRSKKLLFVLAEIERLDNSAKRHSAAAALFARARLMRRLYGPQTDVDWSSAEFYYRYDKRPSFAGRSAAAGVKETWELADDEARTKIGERSRVIELSASQSPLALLARLERDYPESRSVPQAVHERAQYYQSRRQFAKAVDEYRREIQRFPQHELAEKAKEQIARIEHADVILGKTGISASGIAPRLWFACRNADEVDFTARRFDLAGLMKESDATNFRSLWHGWGFNRFFNDTDEKEFKELAPFAGAQAAKWTQPVARSDRVASHLTLAPLTEAGAYLVEARVPGSDQRSRGLVIVTGIALVQKPFVDRVLLWAVDPLSGKPLAGQKIEVQEREWSNRSRKNDTILVADQNGIAEYRYQMKEHSEGLVFASADVRGMTFCELAGRSYDWRKSRDWHVLCLTDRPAYRPGSTVNFRIWVRELADRRYEPVLAGTRLNVSVRDPHYHTSRVQELETDESGSVSGSYTIGAEAPLGEYHLEANFLGDRHHGSAQSFRVEEYKKPEFEVSVIPGKKIASPGEPVTARVEARYYFGLPVAGGAAQYQIFRGEQKQSFSLPAEFDWLYGAGYATFSSARSTDQDDDDPYGRWWRYRYRYDDGVTFRESVAEGQALLDATGAAEIRFDPAALKSAPDRNWRYTIEVEVRDAGRRTVSGSGSILAPRREFQVFAELDRGWYAPGEQVTVEIHARSANDVAVAAAGQAALVRLEQQGGAAPEARHVQDWNASTGADGRSRLEFPAPPPGRYRLDLRTRDSADRDVSAAVEFWVHDAAADFSRSPQPALQIISDRRTYRVGETARLLVVTANDDATVLVCRGPGEHQFLPVPRHVGILEVPITEQDVPNLFVEGTVVREGAVHTETCQLFVPPVRDLLKVEITADKPVHKPGETGKFKIKATDSAGQPVTGDLALTAFDKAVTAIEPESKFGPRELIRARKMERWRWSGNVSTSLISRRFGTTGSFMCPEYYLTDDYVPQIGMMGGAPPQGGDPADSGAQGGDLSGFEPGTELAAATVRSDFSDTALWLAHLQLDAAGEAQTQINFPQSLTTWRLRAYLVTGETRVGDVAQDIITSKNLLLRLQRPRFLVERDEVVLSANVHNRVGSDKTVTAELLVPAAMFRAAEAAADAEGNLRLTARARVPSGGDHRFD
ncbi:MAG: hypothetical protein HY290_28100 [Planctomycetia bacterium]|nr:hypothetical protein [Planctomycetia bacterium]